MKAAGILEGMLLKAFANSQSLNVPIGVVRAKVMAGDLSTKSLQI